MSNVTPINPAAEAKAKLDAKVRSYDDITLIEVLNTVDLGASVEQRIVHARVISELERRHPRVRPAVERWVDDDDDHRTYAQVLTQALTARQTPIVWAPSMGTWPTTHDYFGTINGKRVVRVWEGASGFRAQDENDRLIAITEPTWESMEAKVAQHFHRMGVNV